MFSGEELIEKLKATGRFWIVFTGDSLTSTEWVHPNFREIVEYVLKMELTENDEDWKTPSWGIRTFNFAYDGATTRDLLAKTADIALLNPDLVISLMGGNDPAFGVSLEESMQNIQKISQEISAPLVWCTGLASSDPAKNDRDLPYVQAALGVMQRENFKVLDTFSSSQSFPQDKIFTFKASADNPVEGLKKGDPDLQHPNQLGNAYLAQVVLKDVFGIEFDPDRYLAESSAGAMYPSYES